MTDLKDETADQLDKCSQADVRPEPTATIGRKEARRAAQQKVYDGAANLIAGVIENRGGNYQGVKFLFEFAGLISDDFEEEESSPEFLAIMQQLQRRSVPKSDDDLHLS